MAEAAKSGVMRSWPDVTPYTSFAFYPTSPITAGYVARQRNLRNLLTPLSWENETLRDVGLWQLRGRGRRGSGPGSFKGQRNNGNYFGAPGEILGKITDEAGPSGSRTKSPKVNVPHPFPPPTSVSTPSRR